MTLILLGAAVIAGIFLTGGVYPSQWNWCVLAIGIAGVTARVKNPAVDRRSTLLIAIVAGLALLQIVPLPAALVGILSPARLELAQDSPNFLTLSAAPYETAQQILTLAAYAVVLLLIRHLALTAKSVWVTVWPLLAAAAVESAIGVFQMPIAKGTYVNRDHLAGLLEMILPFAVMYSIALLRRRAILQAWAILTISALILAAILHTYSRTGFFAALVGMLICGCMSFSSRWRIPAVGAAIGLLFIFLPDEPFIARFSNIFGDLRFKIWADALGLIQTFPLFGCGLGAFESCFARFQTAAPMYTVDYAHNDYLQILAELGPVALICGLLFAARLLLAVIRRAKYARAVDDRLLAIAATASLVAMLIHSFVDFNLYIPANGAVFAWICGLAATGLDSPQVGLKQSSQLVKSRNPGPPLRSARV